MRLDGTVVLITGAAGGLGRSVTPAFLKAGATVAAVDRHTYPERLERLLPITGDVTDEADVRRVVAEVVRQAGRIDCLVNLVGGFSPARAIETELGVWQKMLAMNVTSAFLLSKTVAAHMAQRRSGRIVHIGARAALDPFPGAAAYIASKSALIGLIRVLALELGESGIRVNGVLPTTIDTPANRTSMPQADFSKWVKPEAIAEFLIFLASAESSAINGALIPIGS